MIHNANSQVELLENNPEVKSYIYQQITEFEPYISSETIFAVVAKDPTQLADQFEPEGDKYDQMNLAELYRISISLTENGTTIEAEGVSKDIFTAIKLAREKLSSHLQEMHDSVVNQKERDKEIEGLLRDQIKNTVH